MYSDVMYGEEIWKIIWTNAATIRRLNGMKELNLHLFAADDTKPHRYSSQRVDFLFFYQHTQFFFLWVRKYKKIKGLNLECTQSNFWHMLRVFPLNQNQMLMEWLSNCFTWIIHWDITTSPFAASHSSGFFFYRCYFKLLKYHYWKKV